MATAIIPTFEPHYASEPAVVNKYGVRGIQAKNRTAFCEIHTGMKTQWPTHVFFTKTKDCQHCVDAENERKAEAHAQALTNSAQQTSVQQSTAPAATATSANLTSVYDDGIAGELTRLREELSKTTPSSSSVDDTLKKLVRLLPYFVATIPDIERFVEKDGIDASIKAMEKFPSEAGIQLSCLKLLGPMAICEGSHLVIQAKMLSAGAIKAMKRAMKDHSGKSDVQELGYSALSYLSLRDDNKTPIASDDGIITMLDVMDAHSSAEQVQVVCCFLIVGMTSCETLEQLHISRASNIFAWIYIQWQIVFFVEPTHSFCKDYRSKIWQEGRGTDKIIRAMKDFTYSPMIQYAGCKALHMMALDKTIRSELIVSGEALSCVEKAQKTHPNFPPAQYFSAKARKLLKGNTDYYYYYAAVFVAIVAAIVYWFSNQPNDFSEGSHEKKNLLQVVLAWLFRRERNHD